VTSDHPTSAPRAALFRLVLLCVLALALVASVITSVVLFSHRQGQAGTLQADREAAMATTQQFVLRVNTYGPSLLDSSGQMPEYRTRVKAVITPKFAVSFDQGVTVAEQSVKNYGVDRTCAVFATGVEQIDTDTAQVLVAGSFSETVRSKSGKRVSAGEPAPFRLRVALAKINGHWLVDDYQTVTS
jgi:Na+-transporting NADH:ubiquinone oxidoreductase subunit NqrC